MLYTFLLVVHAIIAAILVAIILMQRSEGGGLGVGGSPAGVMSARGAADFLTRGTAILATLFVVMSIGLAALATVERAPRDIDTSLARQPDPVAPTSPVPLADPLAPAAAGLPPTAPAPAASATADAPAVPAAQPIPAEKTVRTPPPSAVSPEPSRREKASEPKSEPKVAPTPAPKAEPKAAPAPAASAPLVLPPKAEPAPAPTPAPAAEVPAPSAQ